MKTIVIYNSQTGFTKQYAQWIAEATGADCLAFEAAKKKNPDAYEAIIFGSWTCAGRISKLSWFKGNIDKWTDKKLIAFFVGANPIDSPNMEPMFKQNFNESELKKINVFYCPGGLRYEKMHALSKFMMKMLVKALNAKKNKTAEEQEMLKMISTSFDSSDRKYIEPILKCLEE